MPRLFAACVLIGLVLFMSACSVSDFVSRLAPPDDTGGAVADATPTADVAALPATPTPVVAAPAAPTRVPAAPTSAPAAPAPVVMPTVDPTMAALPGQVAKLTDAITALATAQAFKPTAPAAPTPDPQVAAIATQVAALDTQVKDLAKRPTLTQDQLNALSSQLTTLQTQVATLVTQKPTADPQVGKLADQVKDLGNQITALQTQLNTLAKATPATVAQATVNPTSQVVAQQPTATPNVSVAAAPTSQPTPQQAAPAPTSAPAVAAAPTSAPTAKPSGGKQPAPSIPIGPDNQTLTPRDMTNCKPEAEYLQPGMDSAPIYRQSGEFGNCRVKIDVPDGWSMETDGLVVVADGDTMQGVIMTWQGPRTVEVYCENCGIFSAMNAQVLAKACGVARVADNLGWNLFDRRYLPSWGDNPCKR